MRSRPERLAALALAAVLAGAPTARAQDLTSELPVAAGAAPSRAQAEEAVAAVQAELSPTRKVNRLRWEGPKPGGSGGAQDGARWLADLFGWIAQSGRLMVWVAAAVLLALLAYYVARLLRGGRIAKGHDAEPLPTHVHELDIRPESLPADVGAAARALWDSAQRRAALALLYRGLLSRLVHAHAVPIRESSTEGDALALAAAVIGKREHDYAARLVLTWQRAVYGHDEPETATVHLLCAEFAPLLDSSPAAPSTSSAAP